MVINDKLKNNYKILIRNNTLIYPLYAYYNIYKTYKNRFVICNDKLTKLLFLLLNNNNCSELLEILYKTIPNYIKLSKISIEEPWEKTGNKYKYIGIIKLLENKNFSLFNYDILLNKNIKLITKYENFIIYNC